MRTGGQQQEGFLGLPHSASAKQCGASFGIKFMDIRAGSQQFL
jgi:hypothetical protein